MHILIGVGLAAVLLYYWLIGHWFARVLDPTSSTPCGQGDRNHCLPLRSP